MSLSLSQKKQIIDLLASGKTASQVASIVGCSRATVQRIKGDAKNAPLMQIARGMAATQQLNEQGEKVVATLQVLKEREPEIQQGLWMMFEGLKCLFEQVLSATDIQDISPRQLPVLAKAAAAIATAYADYSDRVNGLEVLCDEIEKINKSRAA